MITTSVKMNQLDKMVAQHNGQALNLNPLWLYHVRVNFVPLGDTELIEQNGKKTLKTSKEIHYTMPYFRKEVKEYTHEINEEKTLLKIPLYYHDIEETEEDRDAFALSLINPSNINSYIDSVAKNHEITLNLEIVKRDFSTGSNHKYTPLKEMTK